MRQTEKDPTTTARTSRVFTNTSKSDVSNAPRLSAWRCPVRGGDGKGRASDVVLHPLIAKMVAGLETQHRLIKASGSCHLSREQNAIDNHDTSGISVAWLGRWNKIRHPDGDVDAAARERLFALLEFRVALCNAV
jgi:hypothetical protein